MKFCSLALLSLWYLAALPGVQAAPRNWYVATNGNNSAGTDWDNAYTNIHWVLNNAGNGDTIYLAGQTFPLTNQLVWTATDSVTIRGGYAATNSADTPGTSDPDQWPTVLTRANPAVNHRILRVQNVTNGTLQAVTVTGGRLVASGSSGGGGVRIENCPDLQLVDCFINNNTIQNTSVASGTVYGNGLYLVNSLVTLSNCVVKANSCSAGNAQGGGLYMSGGTTTVWGTTIALNQLSYIYTRQGGGVYNNGGMLILRNSMVVGNGTTGGTGDGIYTTGASKTFLENCTVADNAGQGIQRGNGTISATNCIIWGNGADLVGSPFSVAYCNIQKDHASWTNEVNGCISQDPRFERGYYLAADSPCVNAGTNDASFWGLGALTTQTDGTPDAGRVNLGYHFTSGYDSTGADLFVSASGTDTTGTNWAEAFQTVTRALSVARDGSVIYLDSGTYSITSGETFPLSQSGCIGLRIEGTSRTGTVINATGSGQRVLTLQDCANVEISDLTLTGGTNAINGNVYASGLYLSGCGGVRLLSVAITDNIARNTTPASGTTYGGGIYAAGGTLILSNCVVSGNSALGGNSSGGGIYAQKGGVLELYDTIVSNNKGSTLYTRKGGGVYNQGLACRFRNCLVVGNAMTSGSGGGLYQESSGSMILENCTVADNTGGGIYRTANAPVSLINSIVWGNTDDLAGTMSVSYCNIQTTDTFWTNGVNGCISQDPSFDRGYYLAGNSPCVNAGTNDASTWGLDTYSTQFDGTPDSGRVDLGYHYRPDSVTALSYDYYGSSVFSV